MKIVKKNCVGFLVLICFVFNRVVTFILNQKFTPEENYSTIENESGVVPLKWYGSEKNVVSDTF
jgi:hypothetical protein